MICGKCGNEYDYSTEEKFINNLPVCENCFFENGTVPTLINITLEDIHNKFTLVLNRQKTSIYNFDLLLAIREINNVVGVSEILMILKHKESDIVYFATTLMIDFLYTSNKQITLKPNIFTILSEYMNEKGKTQHVLFKQHHAVILDTFFEAVS